MFSGKPRESVAIFEVYSTTTGGPEATIVAPAYSELLNVVEGKIESLGLATLVTIWAEVIIGVSTEAAENCAAEEFCTKLANSWKVSELCPSVLPPLKVTVNLSGGAIRVVLNDSVGKTVLNFVTEREPSDNAELSTTHIVEDTKLLLIVETLAALSVMAD